MTTIISADNGSVSGSAGLKSTADSSGILVLQTGANTTAVTIDASQVVSTTNGVTIQGLTVGRGAGAVSTNTAVGASALAANTSGVGNTALGDNALLSNTTASYNTALGRYAAQQNTTGGGLTAVGHQALVSNTTGTANVAIGGYDSSSGTFAPLYQNTTGSSNVGVGVGALRSNTTASNNTAVGYQAGYSTSTVNGTTYLGYQAGYAATGGQNTSVGSQSGYSLTGTYNTLVGIGSGSAITSGSKNSVLGSYNGNQSGLDIRTASNYIVLSDGDGNPVASCSGSRTWIFGDGGSSSGLAVLLAQAATNNGPTLIGRTGSYGSQTARWYIGSDSWIKGGTDYDSLTIASGSAASGGVKLTSGATSWVSASDLKLKNITGSYENALSDIAQIQAVKFTWKHDAGNKPCVGVIAQSVAAVVPEAVDRVRNSKEDETEYLGVRYTELIPLMIASIQEQQALIESLTTRLTALENPA